MSHIGSYWEKKKTCKAKTRFQKFKLSTMTLYDEMSSMPVCASYLYNSQTPPFLPSPHQKWKLLLIPALLFHCWDEPTIQSSKHYRQPKPRINAKIFISSTFTAPTIKPTGHWFKFDLRPKGLGHHQEAETSQRLTTTVAVPLAERICRISLAWQGERIPRHLKKSAHPARKQHCLQDKTLR